MEKFNQNKQTLNLLDGVQKNKDVPGWNTLHEFDNSSQDKSFTAKVYKQGNKIIIAFAGTDIMDKNDLWNDWSVKRGKSPSQYYEAKDLYEKVKAKYPNAQIESTGYSLGGTISNLLSHHTGIKSTALAPIGSKHIAENNPKEFPYGDGNITTYGRKSDDLFKSNLNRQSGKVYILPDLPNDHSNEPWKQHLLHNYTIYDFMQAKQYEPDHKTQRQRIQNGRPLGFAASITDYNALAQQLGLTSFGMTIPQSAQPSAFSGYSNPLTGTNRIFTREDIGTMSPEEFSTLEKEIDAQVKAFNGTMPTNGDLQTEAISGGGVIYVNSYTRSDGTKVNGYYRSK
ncbi:hypothetical protein HDR58_00670 [bacterium]|nr:hypothetical protein [bacterium]